MELEEAWIIYALVIDDGLQQIEVAQMLGRHKSWINRRLALIERLRNEVIHRSNLGESERRIAKQLGVSRWKVTKIIRQNRKSRSVQEPNLESSSQSPNQPDTIPASLGRPVQKRASKLDAFEPQLQQLLQRYPRITVIRLQEGRRKVQLFSYILGYFGGVAATCLYDNMKVVVTRGEDDHPIYNTRFLAFATHYGYRPWACQIRRHQTKGKVERRWSYMPKRCRICSRSLRCNSTRPKWLIASWIPMERSKPSSSEGSRSSNGIAS